MTKKLRNLILFLAFIEGGGVMCVELCSAKILSPVFGTSIYVWAAVLGITLTALMSGYYMGGYWSTKYRKKEFIFWVMLVAGGLVALSPLISSFILKITINFNLLLGTIFSLMGFLFLPLFLFGSTSPLVINLLTEEAKDSGKSSGFVYAISTLGGIITTFVVGFYTLPTFGISNTLYTYGVLVMGTALFLFITTRTIKTYAPLLTIAVMLSYNFMLPNHEKIIYQSEGILGQVKVIDRFHVDKQSGEEKEFRELLVNNISQTIMDKSDPGRSYWDYVDVLMGTLNQLQVKEKTLLLGLGGGTLFKQLEKQELDIDVVEIDGRIEQIAKDYFEIENDLNVIVDDARHYINTTKEEYNLVIYDLYHSETPPVHLMTGEAFAEIKNRLTSEGILVVNYYGYINGSKGKGARSIYKTLLAENYNVQLIATPGEESYRNLLFICSKHQLPETNIENTITLQSIDLEDAVLLTDDRPILEHIYLEAALDWRKNYNEFNAKYFLRNDIPLFE